MAELQLLLLSLVTALRHPLVQAVQLQASFVLLIGTVGWALSGLRRGREAARLTAAGYLEALQAAAADAAAAAANGRAATAAVAVVAVHACSAGSVAAEGAEQQQQQQGSSLKHRVICRSTDSAEAVAAAASPLLNTLQQQEQQQQEQQQCAATTHSIYKSRPPGSQAPWPPVAVICPVKGCRQHSRDNWATQLSAHYGGPRVFVFVVESAADPAVTALQDMMAQLQQQKQQKLQQHQSGDKMQQQQQTGFGELPGRVLHAWRQGPQQVVLLLDAGLAHSCSQKIHNILGGIEVALAATEQQQQDITQQQQQDITQQQQQQEHDQGLDQQHYSGKRPNNAVTGCSRSLSNSSSSSGGYVCVFDDDVALHPLSLCQLVDEMQAHPELFMATGYPFDIVATPSSSKAGTNACTGSSSGSWFGRLLAYAAASYHLPLLIGFSVADRGEFVWGGAMVLRTSELRKAAAEEAAAAAATGQAAAGAAAATAAGKVAAGGNGESKLNILQVWRHGGYSDDLLLAAYCTEHGLPIGMPASAYFPQQLPPTYTPKQYWNYLRRQLYVLDTYHSRHNRALNHTMMLAHSYGSAVFTAAVLASSLQLVLLVAAAVLLLQQFLLPWSTAEGARGGESALRFGSSSSSDSLLGWQQLFWSCTTISTWLFVALTASSLAAIQYMSQQVLQLFRVLSPSAGDEVLHPRISLSLLWLGWVLENAVLPFCMLYSFCCDQIVWGGITYFKQGGRVSKVVHPRQQ